MVSVIDLTGQRFGKLTVVERSGSRNDNALWLCRCDCGGITEVVTFRLRNGNTQSCGCLRDQNRVNNVRDSVGSLKHGHNPRERSTKTYNSWKSMKRRCRDPLFKQFYNYGGRGITFCPRWESFENFLEDMGERPEGKTLDRIDTNGNYEPSNCKWSTPKEQQRNRRKEK